MQTILVCGAGTMGNGIAQTAAQNGYATTLFDLSIEALTTAQSTIEANWQYLLDKQRLSPQAHTAALQHIQYTTNPQSCTANLIIEAIVEKLEAKINLFNQLAAINSPTTIFASNTSSLSITDLQQSFPHPGHVAGLHFFNPAPLMKLVEVVKGTHTDDAVIQTLVTFVHSLQKTPVVCKDAPGFIVNRVARHYYLEACKLVEEGIADFATVDAIAEASGFKMGPFKLMDLIGNDINLAVSQSLYDAFNQPIRFRPSIIQQQKVQQGQLGRKTKKGYYTYK